MPCMALGLLTTAMWSLAAWSLVFTKLYPINTMLWMECVVEQYAWTSLQHESNKSSLVQTLLL